MATVAVNTSGVVEPGTPAADTFNWKANVGTVSAVGGDGNDVFNLVNSNNDNNTAFGDAGSDTFNLFDGPAFSDGNKFNGGADGDTFNLQYSFRNGVLNGDAGNDTFNVAVANSAAASASTGLVNGNVLNGGDGDDVFRLDTAADSLTANGGKDNDKFTLNGADNNTLNGNDGNDEFFLNAGSNGNKLDGGDGTDTLHTTANADTVDVTAGTVGSNTIANFEIYFLGSDNDTFKGGAAVDIAVGDLGADTLSGNGGNDVLAGSTFDVAAGKWAADTARNTINGNAGNDLLVGGSKGDILNGGADNDIIISESTTGAANINGGAGDDVIVAGRAGDNIFAGSGNLEYVLLGVGADTVQSNGASKWTTIDAFNSTSDKLELSAASGILTFDQLLAHAVQFNGQNGLFGTVIVFDNGNALFLNGVNKTSLNTTNVVAGSTILGDIA